MERICQCRNFAGCDRRHDLFAHSGVQVQMLLAHPRLAVSVISDAPLFIFLCLPQ